RSEFSQMARQFRGLIVAAASLASPMQRYGNADGAIGDQLRAGMRHQPRKPGRQIASVGEFEAGYERADDVAIDSTGTRSGKGRRLGKRPRAHRILARIEGEGNAK